MCSHRANNSLFSALLVSRGGDQVKKDGDFIALDRKHQKKIVMMRSGFSGKEESTESAEARPFMLGWLPMRICVAANDSTSRDVKIPLLFLAQLGSTVVRTDLIDSETYIFSRQALQCLDPPTPTSDRGAGSAPPSVVTKSIREDFIPRLLERQFLDIPNSISNICTSPPPTHRIVCVPSFLLSPSPVSVCLCVFLRRASSNGRRIENRVK